VQEEDGNFPPGFRNQPKLSDRYENTWIRSLGVFHTRTSKVTKRTEIQAKLPFSGRLKPVWQSLLPATGRFEFTTFKTPADNIPKEFTASLA
jgi:hypothetical protein